MSERIKLTDDERAQGNALDKIAKNQNRIGWGRGFMTKETIDGWHDTLKRLRFRQDLESVPDLINVPDEHGNPNVYTRIRGTYENSQDYEILMTREEASDLEEQVRYIKYKFSDVVYRHFKEERPELFVKQNYINPAEITDPIAIRAMGALQTMEVSSHDDLEENLERAFDDEFDKTELPEPFDGIAYQIGIEHGDVNGKSTTLEFYIGISEETKQSSKLKTPDIAVYYVEQSILSWANTKSAYITKEMHWKDDYGTITRMLKKILEKHHMTDFKKDITSRERE